MPTKKATTKVKHPKMDALLIAFGDKSEVRYLCSIWKNSIGKNIGQTELRLLVVKWQNHCVEEGIDFKKHSRRDVEALLVGAGFTKHPRKKK